MTVKRMIPYMTRSGPPELIPVTRPAEIPNHELVRENATPNNDSTE
jgi:hypothetical protein